MAKPAIIQHLSHDKFLTRKNFPDFVETFNYTVDRLENLKGDYDTNPKNGHIKIDNSNPEHPIIRWMGGTLSGGNASLSGYTGTVKVLTGAQLTLSSLQFSVSDLTFKDGLLLSSLSSTPIDIAAEAYDNV